MILTRDPWMHRLDLARTTGQVLTADHDGVIVADTVAEWAHRHGQPYRLELTGPAGASWSSGTGGEEIVMDAADFCRIVCGRSGPDGGQLWGLLATQVPPERKEIAPCIFIGSAMSRSSTTTPRFKTRVPARQRLCSS